MENTNAPTTTETAASAKKDLYTIDGTLTTDIELRSAKTKNGAKPFVYGKIQGKNGKTHTIVSYVGTGIAFLTGRKSGEAVRVFGTFEQQDKGRTFSAMGESVKREKAPAPEAAVEVAETAEVAEEVVA